MEKTLDLFEVGDVGVVKRVADLDALKAAVTEAGYEVK